MSGKLNCRPGDLAIVTPPKTVKFCPSTGTLVDVLSLVGSSTVRAPDGHVFGAAPAGECDIAWWMVRHQRAEPTVSDSGAVVMSIYSILPDSRLRPIRDQPGDDETLAWASLPNRDEVAA